MLKNAGISADALAAVLDQSTDCVKLIGMDGKVRWMNSNGLCAMEIDDFSTVRGKSWDQLWPEVSRALITDALPAAAAGETVRFDAFCPTAKGTSRWWNVTVSRVTDNDGSEAGYLAVSRDITEAETGRQALIIAAAELRHRLKNTYAMIGSLMLGFAKGDAAREAFAHEMQSRLVSLSQAQALFSNAEAPCEVATLIPALIAPFETPGCKVTIETSPDLLVPQGQADAIALVLGELAVNSAKHGGLANGGSIGVDTREDGGGLTLVWTEKSDQAVTAHDRPGGQGLQLIERIVRARDGTIMIDWHDDGLTVVLAFKRS